MFRLLFAGVLLVLVSSAWAQAPMPVLTPSPSPVAGTWTGTLDAGTAQLRLVFRVTPGADGTLAASLESVDQGSGQLPAERASFVKNTLSLSFATLHGTFSGTLSADGKVLTGTWTQGVPLPLTLTHTDKLPPPPTPPNRPQEPKPPFPYESRDVTYQNKVGGVTLAGTLTTPSGSGPFPCALMITGSGPQDRDETLMGHKPFLVIADYLTRRGIAVLRVDDRGVGGSTGKNSQSTDADFAGDVAAGLAFLQTQPDIDTHKVGLIGHSEGGLIAPIVAAAHPKDVAFIVLLAGPGTPGVQVLLQQEALIIKSMGGDASRVAWQQAQQKKVFAILNTTPDNDAARVKLDALLDEQMTSLPPDLASAKDQYRAQFTASYPMVLTPWFRSFLHSDPVPVLQKVTCPVLALGGSKDLQVPEPENLEAIKAALTAGGNKDVTAIELPGLNHLFQTTETGAISEYAKIEETFAPIALKTLSDWIVSHTKETVK